MAIGNYNAWSGNGDNGGNGGKGDKGGTGAASSGGNGGKGDNGGDRTFLEAKVLDLEAKVFMMGEMQKIYSAGQQRSDEKMAFMSECIERWLKDENDEAENDGVPVVMGTVVDAGGEEVATWQKE